MTEKQISIKSWAWLVSLNIVTVVIFICCNFYTASASTPIHTRGQSSKAADSKPPATTEWYLPPKPAQHAGCSGTCECPCNRWHHALSWEPAVLILISDRPGEKTQWVAFTLKVLSPAIILQNFLWWRSAGMTNIEQKEETRKELFLVGFAFCV